MGGGGSAFGPVSGAKPHVWWAWPRDGDWPGEFDSFASPSCIFSEASSVPTGARQRGSLFGPQPFRGSRRVTGEEPVSASTAGGLLLPSCLAERQQAGFLPGEWVTRGRRGCVELCQQWDNKLPKLPFRTRAGTITVTDTLPSTVFRTEFLYFNCIFNGVFFKRVFKFLWTQF